MPGDNDSDFELLFGAISFVENFSLKALSFQETFEKLLQNSGPIT